MLANEFFSISYVYNCVFSGHIACPGLVPGESRNDNRPSVCRLRHARFHRHQLIVQFNLKCMRSKFKNFNRWLAAFGVAAFLMVAGWQFGLSSTDVVFAETEVALENAVAGSGFTCKVEVINCSDGDTRQVCHKNGKGVLCECGDSTGCDI